MYNASKVVSSCSYAKGRIPRESSLDIAHQLKDSSYKYFDFGNSHEQKGMKVNNGLNYWKEGYGARSLTHDFYEINISNFYKLNNLII